MYYDHEGHAIATSIGDAASTLTEHEKAAYFGYDCTSPCCADDAAEAEHDASMVELTERFANQATTREATITELTDLADPWHGTPED